VLGKGDPKKQDLPTLELEDHPEGQHAQETVETYGTVTNNIKRLIKEFRIYRWSPDNPYRKPYLHLSKCRGTFTHFFFFLTISEN
jgi:succinate dehydrogenase (ubiquinone) iron-sulfur subunit